MQAGVGFMASYASSNIQSDHDRSFASMPALIPYLLIILVAKNLSISVFWTLSGWAPTTELVKEFKSPHFWMNNSLY